MLFESGAKKLHLRIASPQNTATTMELFEKAIDLLAAKHNIDEDERLYWLHISEIFIN